MSIKNHGGMISTEENWFIHQNSLAILPAAGTGGGNNEFCVTNGSLTCLKFYDMGLTSLLPL
jgi:hypothetical protein